MTPLRLLNLTPHACHLYLRGGRVVTLERYVDPAVGAAVDARMASEVCPLGARAVSPHGTLGDVLDEADACADTIAFSSPQRPTGLLAPLPCAEDDGATALLVSAMVGEYVQAHPDAWRGPVYAPDTSPLCAVRSQDEATRGQIIGVRGLVVYKEATAPAQAQAPPETAVFSGACNALAVRIASEHECWSLRAGAANPSPLALVAAYMITVGEGTLMLYSSSTRQAEKNLAVIVDYVKQYSPKTLTTAAVSMERLLLSTGVELRSVVCGAETPHANTVVLHASA